MALRPVSSYGEPFPAGKERTGGPPDGSRWRDRGAKFWRNRLYALDRNGNGARMSVTVARLAGVGVLAALLASCGESQQPTRAAPPSPSVTVAKPVARTIVDQDEYVGRFVAVDSVEIRARVWGYLDSVHFTDGQVVKKGDLLFTIDRRPYQITLDQTRANVAQ